MLESELIGQGSKVDISSITAAVSSLKMAGDMVKGLINLRTADEVQSKARELNQQIIDAQQQVFVAHAAQVELLGRVGELEGQVQRMKDWEAQKARYDLAAPFAGCMVYALKKDLSNGQPPHYLCVTCFERGEKSILQGREEAGPGGRHAAYICSRRECGCVAVTRWSNVTPPEYLENIKPA